MRTHMRQLVIWLTSALLLALATPALAVNAITFGTPALSVNYNTLQFRLPYTGDDNANSTILVRYSKGNSFQASKADTAVVPFRDKQLRRFTGVIPWLDQGTKYTLQITVTDPDGGGTTVTPAFVTTLASPPHTIPANRLFVSPSGNDANAGTLALPKRTIMGAVSALTAGGQVRVLPGIYYETAWLQQEGTPSSYYSIVGHGNPDSVIVDGSDPTLLNTTWSPYLDNTGTQINAIYYKVTSTATTANVANIVAGWGQRLHTKQTMDQLKNFAAYPLFPSQGWFKNLDTLFVRLEGGVDPSLTTMHVATRAFGLRMTGKYWRAESLTVRFTSDKGFFLGHFISPDSSATGAVIRNCRGYSIGLQGIYGNNNVDNVLVDSCYFEDGRVDTWGYNASKLHFEENTTGVTAVGRSWVIRNNVFTGHANGVQVVGSATDTVTKFGGADADIYYNKVLKMADDGIENDTSQGVNQAIWGNLVSGCIFGLSPNPMYTGPVYVMYNVFDTEDSGGIKMGGGATAAIFFYHNTFTSAGCFSTAEHVGGGYKNIVFRNNIMAGVQAPGCFRYPYMDDSGGLDTTVTTFGAIMDYDLWHGVNPFGGYLQWRGITRPWSYVQGVLGWESHGVTGAPTYVDSAANNFRPTAGSLQLNKGVRIQGINTRNKTGTALVSGLPDVGAYELGVTSPAQPPFSVSRTGFTGDDDPMQAGLAFAMTSPRPNPTTGGTLVLMSLPAETRVNAGVYDVAGRQVFQFGRAAVWRPGVHELRWSGVMKGGARATPGVYFLRVSTPLGSATRRIVIVEN